MKLVGEDPIAYNQMNPTHNLSFSPCAYPKPKIWLYATMLVLFVWCLSSNDRSSLIHWSDVCPSSVVHVASPALSRYILLIPAADVPSLTRVL